MKSNICYLLAGTALSVSVMLVHTILPESAQASTADRSNSLDQSIILDRPLFDPSRRPPAIHTIALGTPRLAGLIEGSGDKRAIFSVPGQDHSTIVRLNGAIGTWKVIGIDHGIARIEDGSSVKMLRPERDHQIQTPEKDSNIDSTTGTPQ